MLVLPTIEIYKKKNKIVIKMHFYNDFNHKFIKIA